MIFLEADLSQIESKYVFLLTGDPELQRLAKLRSYEFDVHTSNAEMLFGKDVKSKPDFKLYRHVGKITSHGAQRDMRGDRLSGTILKELNISYTPEKCNDLLTKYHGRYPAIRASYFRDIRKRVMRDRQLVNSWGRRILFNYDRLDDELFRQAYSFLPQSEAADLLKLRGLVPLYYYLKSLYNRPPNVTVHDSLLASVRASDAYDVAVYIRDNIERPQVIAGTEFIPEVNFKLGVNWAADEKKLEGIEFKRLPSRNEFESQAYILEGYRECLNI